MRIADLIGPELLRVTIAIGFALWVMNGGIERLKMCLAEWIKKREAALNVRKQKR